MNSEENESRTRGKYAGSKAPGVNPKNVSSLKEYGGGMERLEQRFNFLAKEYQGIEQDFTSATNLVEKAKIHELKKVKERQIDRVLKTKTDLESRLPEIEAGERTVIESTSFNKYEF